MELKLATANDMRKTMDEHFRLDSQIMGEIGNMTLAGKRRMADQIAGYCADCEKEAK